MIPKFRIFIKANTKTVGGLSCNKDMMYEEISNIDFYNQEVTVWGCGIEGCEMCDDTFRLEDVILMQSTGLHDKNGIEIYEGDILNHPLQGMRKVYYPFTDRVASYGLENIENGMRNTLEDAHRLYEVVGNIHSHSHLLDDGGHRE